MVYLLILFLFSLVAAEDPAAQIRAVRVTSNRALAARDLKGYAESLAQDYVVVRGNGTFGGSPEASVAGLAELFNGPNAVTYERVTDKVELSAAAALAAEHGHWTAFLPGGKRAYAGTYLAQWRLTAGVWKIRSELFVVLECGDAAACAAYRR